MSTHKGDDVTPLVAVAEALREWQRHVEPALLTPTTLWIDKAEMPAQVALDALRDAGFVIRKDEPEHFVVFDEDGWYIEHSIECRDKGDMRACVYQSAVRAIADEFNPDMLGRWKITDIDSEGLPSLEWAQSGSEEADRD